MTAMKKLFWIRTGLLLTVLIFAVLGGRFLYTGAESALPLDMAVTAIPLEKNTILVQAFSPGHPHITAISLALQPYGRSPATSAAPGELTVVLTGHDTGAEVYRNTVSLEGIPDHWYLNFPMNCRLDPNAIYDLSLSAENCPDGEYPSLYLVSQSARIPELAAPLCSLSGSAALPQSVPEGTENLTETLAMTETVSAAGETAFDAGTETVSADGEPAFAAVGLTYEVPVPSRFVLFLALLAVILLCTSATAFFSRRETEKKAKDITLGRFLSVRIRRTPLIDILFFTAVTIAAVTVRIAFLPVKSNDYWLCFESWISDMRSSGILNALGRNIGDYPPLYVTPLILLSALPFEPVTIIKLMPCLFDFLLAAVCVRLSGQLGVAERDRRLTLYAVILLNPLTLLNSAAWGQCDSIYSSFLLLALLAACSARLWSTEAPLEGKNAFWRSGDGICLLFAVAISFKLQAIFFLPILCLLWITQKRNVLKPVQLLWVPIVYTISCIPMFLAGRSLKVMFKIYLGQANRSYGTLTLNYPNLYSLIGTWSETLYDGYFVYGMLLAFLLLLLLFYRLYSRRVKLSSLTLCKVAALSILTVCFCIPLIHERYAYVAEMLLFVIMLKESKYIRPALATMACTLFTYCTYLMQLEQSFTVMPDWAAALIRLGVIVYLAEDIFQPKKQPLKDGQ